MTVESLQDIAGLRHIGRIVAQSLQTLEAAVRPGMSTAELDAQAGELLKATGARSAPYVTYRFPGNSCISINDEATHGIPGGRIIRPGDLVKIDLSASAGGYFADAAVTVAVPPVAERGRKLTDCARAALDAACAVAVAGKPITQIGRAIQRIAQQQGFTVIPSLAAHGIGRALHEEPSVPMHFDPRDKRLLVEGQVITIEPHITTGKGRIYQAKDGWTLRTRDKGYVAQFEHTLVITKGRPLVLTSLS
ncbi:MAG: type I methionyl aminopeptidase [Caldilineaceae bacterium]|nr:type I methionyl aminopeptidase [Caldilineaceae bacterium]